MTTDTVRIEGMEKELLEYYHKNEDRFKKYSYDIDLLKAKLFEGMLKDGCFPKRQPKNKRDLTTEYECTQWLSRAAGEQMTFGDFRKMFKSRLKKCELWSEEFYGVCKDIISERQNFLNCREHYKLINNNSNKIEKNNLQEKYDFIVEQEPSYNGYSTINYLVTKNTKTNLVNFDSMNNDLMESYFTEESNSSFDDFYKKYKRYLYKYPYMSKDFWRKCLAIIKENEFEVTARKFNAELFNKKVKELISNKANSSPININNDIIYKRMDSREIPFLRVGGVLKMPPSKETLCKDCEHYMKQRFGEDFDIDIFCEYFNVELSLYKKWSDRWKLVCLRICHENVPQTNLTKENKLIQKPNVGILESIKFFLLYTLAYWGVFSIIGLILYNLRPIINFIFFFLSKIVVLSVEIIIEIISIMFTGNSANLNWDDSIPAETDSILPWFICMFILLIPWFYCYASDVNKKI